MILKGKNAIVTGANGGIGRAIVAKFAQNGANVWAFAHSVDVDLENDLMQLGRDYSVQVKPIYCDLENLEEVKKSAKKVLGGGEPIDILVNNAGIAKYSAFSLMSMNNMKEVFDVNYFASMQFTQIISRRMRKQSASIIFVSSVAGIDAVCGNMAYGCSKAAISQATKIMAKELAPQGIRVNAVAPGMVDTKMKHKADEKIWNELIAATYLKRVAQPEEIANVICFLASDMASYVTGQIIRVDGGMN